jgi:excisionase family DNA binding protein
MTNSNGFHTGDPPPGHGRSGAGEAESILKIVRHVTLALCAHVRRLHQEALPVPHEVEELAAVLMRIARTRQDPPTLADEFGTAHYVRMPDRLLVTKGEAAERLGISIRTVERLVATGQLPQIYIERLARFRVSDLEAYVNGLAEKATADSENAIARDCEGPDAQSRLLRQFESR